MKAKQSDKRVWGFMVALSILMVVITIRCYGEKVDAYNTTLLAFSYKYGFISRGMIGSIYAVLNHLLGGRMMNYPMALRFTQLVTVVFLLVLIVFYSGVIKKIRGKLLNIGAIIIVAYTVVIVSSYTAVRNMGRVDIYMISCSLIAVLLLVYEKAEWLVIPLTTLAVMFHQGYVFMFFNVVLVLLIYKMYTRPKKRKKYIVIFVMSFLITSGLFLYFEFFSHIDGEQFVQTIISDATVLSYDGEYHPTLIDHEILGVDLTQTEHDYHINNFVELPLFIIICIPYLYYLIGLMKGVWKQLVTREQKMVYFFILFGFLTIVPNFILKIDYARWIISIITYFSVTILALLAMHDPIMEKQIEIIKGKCNHSGISEILMVYPIIFLPLWDVFISDSMQKLAEYVNKLFLHLW